MSDERESRAKGYDRLYEEFDSPLMRRMRLEAYDEDIGQHSWVTAEELAKDILLLGLSSGSRLLDVGCGPGGPLSYVASRVRCRGTGLDVSPPAIASARTRADALGLTQLLQFEIGDLNDAIPFAAGSFQAAMSLDVVLHLRDRAALFANVARVLTPAGRWLFTDAGVVTGTVSSDEIRWRALHGFTQFTASGVNERLLQLAGLRHIESQDRTPSLLKTASGRLVSRLAHRAELEQLEGTVVFEEQSRYLETIVNLSERGAIRRMMYLAEREAP